MAVTGRGRKFKAWLRKPRLAGQVNKAIRRVERFGATEDSGSAAFLDWIQVTADTPASSPALDDGGGWWGSIQSVVVWIAVATSASLAAGNAQSQTVKHQDEVPYATGNPIGYGHPYTQRAQVKPVFVSWAQGDEFPQQAAPTVGLDDSGFFPSVKPPEPVIWLPQSEDFTPTKLVEEEASLPFSVNGEIGFKVEWPNDTLARIQVEESYWESPFTIPQIPGVPRWEHQDEIPQQAAPAQGSGGLTYRSVKVFSWHQEDPLPEQTVIFPAEEAEAFLQPPIKEPPQEVSFHTDEIPTRVEEEGWEFSAPAQLPAVSWVWNQQDEAVTAPPAFSPLDEDWVVPYSLPSDASGIIWVTDDDISPEFAIEEPGWKAEWLIPKPFTEVFWTTDELPTAAVQPQGGGGVVYDEISIFRWYQEDPLPVTATPLGIDEEPWNPPVLSLEGPKWQYFPDEVIGPEAINGTSATINANDTSNASGTTIIVGSATNTNNDDTSNASGTTTIVGTSTTTNADDTSNASGSIGGAVSGDSATTNNDDTSSANGTTTIVGTSSTTNENDTNSATGTSIVNGSAADTNNNDTSAASGSSGTPPAGGTHTLPMTGAGPS